MHLLHGGIAVLNHCASAAFTYFQTRQRNMALDDNASRMRRPKTPRSEQRSHSTTGRNAMAFATDTRSLGATIGQRFSEFRASVTDQYAKYAIYRNTVSELNSLTDRDLADLGLTRSMIRGVAAEAASGAK